MHYSIFALMNKKYLFIALFSFLSLFCYAQTATIYGYISQEGENSKPIKDVNIYIENWQQGTTTDKNGYYKLTIPANKEVTIEFSHTSYLEKLITTTLKKGESIEYSFSLGEKRQEIGVVEVIGTQSRSENIVMLDSKKSSPLTSITGIETHLKIEAGVYSTSELSSQYNVRGGNFDENAVYVNNVPIYKPLLISAGKQEGLSFINPHLVESISFSAGGYEAQYGDKMSSVLDITYKKPTTQTVQADISFMGGALSYGSTSKNKKFTHNSSFRYKNTTLLLNGLAFTYKGKNRTIFNSLQDSGKYVPRFLDFQSYLTYDLNKNTNVEAILYASGNTYKFYPVLKETVLATEKEIYTLPIYFEGSESDQFNAYVGALSLTHNLSDSSKFTITYSYSINQEKETYDILGQYRLNDLKQLDEVVGNTDSLFRSATGSYFTHARNTLTGHFHNLSLNGKLVTPKNIVINYGLGMRNEKFTYSVYEWMYVDSAGYSIPYSEDDIQFRNFLKGDISHSYTQWYAYAQAKKSHKLGNGILTSKAGIRLTFRPINNELNTQPRIKISYRPNRKKFIVFHFATGIYYQTPFFKEMVSPEITLYKDIQSQYSIHILTGSDIDLTIWNRPFKFVSAAYYKNMDIIPYNIDNVKIEYLPHLRARAYATGIDLKLNGEFIKDTESWISLSVMQTKENVEGDTLRNGEPAGWIRRPTDQRVNVGLFFQDYLPMNDSYKVNLTLMFGSKLPTGIPSNQRVYKDEFPIPEYRRVDMGMSKVFIDDKNRKGIKYLSLGAEIFNLLNITNVISYLWIQDIEGRYRALPNNLTSRTINLKLSAKI